MALIMNGTTIPTNVANVLKYNGTNITTLIFNGTTVWAQSLFNAKWSGNSIINAAGIEVSNNLFRLVYEAYKGAWITATTSGTFTGGPSLVNNQLEISVSSNLMRVLAKDPVTGKAGAYGNWVTFTLATATFTGSSLSYQSATDYYGATNSWSISVETSGGLLRYGHGFSKTIGYWGPYISLK